MSHPDDARIKRVCELLDAFQAANLPAEEGRGPGTWYNRRTMGAVPRSVRSIGARTNEKRHDLSGRESGFSVAEFPRMDNVTRILSQIESGDPSAAEQLLPLVYTELRKLAAQRLAQEKPGQTLQPTALVHEAYMRLVDQTTPQQWENRRHFFAAAAEAMRRIMVESARRKKSHKRGGEFERIELASDLLVSDPQADRLVAADSALSKLAQEDAQAAELVKLRFFAGFSITQAAEVLGISRSTAYEQWTYARAWLQCAIEDEV